jgi:hypothetical protein
MNERTKKSNVENYYGSLIIFTSLSEINLQFSIYFFMKHKNTEIVVGKSQRNCVEKTHRRVHAVTEEYEKNNFNPFEMRRKIQGRKLEKKIQKCRLWDLRISLVIP